MDFLLNTLIVLFTMIAMEAWAWWMHKYLLHGPLWFLHKSHHSPRHGWWEDNDWVSILYGVAAAALIMYGLTYGSRSLYVGIGIALYGLLYFFLHDVLIHRRLKLRYRPQHPYLRRLIRAHKMHHKHMQRDDSEAFGFLYAHAKYAVREAKKAKR